MEIVLQGSEVLSTAGESSITVSVVVGDLASSETGVGGLSEVTAGLAAAALFILLLV